MKGVKTRIKKITSWFPPSSCSIVLSILSESFWFENDKWIWRRESGWASVRREGKMWKLIANWSDASVAIRDLRRADRLSRFNNSLSPFLSKVVIEKLTGERNLFHLLPLLFFFFSSYFISVKTSFFRFLLVLLLYEPIPLIYRFFLLDSPIRVECRWPLSSWILMSIHLLNTSYSPSFPFSCSLFSPISIPFYSRNGIVHISRYRWEAGHPPSRNGFTPCRMWPPSQ